MGLRPGIKKPFAPTFPIDKVCAKGLVSPAAGPKNRKAFWGADVLTTLWK